MTLFRRAWLMGAVLPSVALMLSVLGGARVLERALLAAVDRALLAQAAAEGVSLFDGPPGQVHLHLDSSPLLDVVRPFAPEGVVYGLDGAVRAHFPVSDPLPGPLQREHPGAPGPTLFTRDGHRGRMRMVQTEVRSPTGETLVLELHTSLAPVSAVVRRFLLVGGLGWAAVTLVLSALQVLWGRSLQRRLGRLRDHLALLERGALDTDAPDDRGHDEVGEVARVLAGATQALRAARDVRERLVADAAHELRTPLTLMRTRIDLALRRPRSQDELREALQATRDEVDRLGRLARQLLDLAAARVLEEREPCDLARLVEDSVASSAPALEARGGRMRLVSTGEARVVAEPIGLRQAVDNLLSNAVKFSPEGGEVEVRVETADGLCAVVVRDQGPGIPESEREAVLEPFRRLDRSVPGTGLGLSIAREVAQRHGGRVRFGRPDRGTEAVLELPRGQRTPD